MALDPLKLVLDAVDALVHDRHGGSYPNLLQSCLAGNYLGDAYVVVLAMDRARMGDLDERIRKSCRSPEPWMVLCECKEAIADMEQSLASVSVGAAVEMQLGKLKRVVNKALEKEVAVK